MTWFSFLFVWTLQIHCYNFYSVCTYVPELIVVPFFKNSINRIPSLTQKMVAMTLPAEVCASNLYSLIFSTVQFSTLLLPLFSTQKGALWTPCFADDSELEHYVCEELWHFSKEFYATSIQLLMQRWKIRLRGKIISTLSKRYPWYM